MAFLFVFTLFFIGIASKLLAMEKHMKIIFFGIWSAMTLFFLPISLSFQSLMDLGIVSISISTAGMIIIGFAIRFFAINWLPKVTFIIIWGLASIRLLIPFSIPTGFNVWNLFDNAQSASVGNSPANHMTIFQLGLEQTPIQIAQETSYNVFEIFFLIWIIGMIIASLYFIITHYRFRKEVSDSLPVENDFVAEWLCRHQILRTIEVRQSEKISSPLTYGIFRPVILLPKTMNWHDETQLKYILAHEYVHIRRFDYAVKIVFATALCVHWFNPLVWAMYMVANRDIELSCDEAVLNMFGRKAKSSYALMLIDMAENRNQPAMLYSSFSKHPIEERIKVMVNMKKTSIVGAALAVTLVGGAMVAFASPENNESPSVSEMGNVTISGVTEMDYESYKAWIERQLENNPNWYSESCRKEMQENLEVLRNGGRFFFLGEENGDDYFNRASLLIFYPEEVDMEAELYHFRYHAFDFSNVESQVMENIEAVKNRGDLQKLLINGEEVDAADFINGKIELDHIYHNEIEIVDTNGLITTWGI